jgi:hypothetical protein
MAELKNSQRISYKATYNQISPSVTKGGDGTTSSPTQSLMRAVEKTSFVQALRVLPEELSAAKAALFKAAPSSAVSAADLSGVLAAIETLIADKTASSTLNNAPLFAQITPVTLVTFANGLIADRQTTANAINQSIADIVSAYRGSLTPSPAAPAATTSAASTAKPAKSTAVNAVKTVETRQTSVTDSGIPIVTTSTTTLPAAKPARGKTSVQVKGQSIHVAVDDSQQSPSAFASILAAPSGESYNFANSDAIVWAETYQPQLFATLSNQLRPYTGLSASELATVGGSTAILDLLKSTFESIFNPGKLGGVVSGFQSRMTIEPVGNLHLERLEMYPAGVERGELLHSVPLAPGETVNISHKEWSITEKEFEDIVDDYFEGYSEQGVADKTDMSMSNESQSQHATALNVGASLSASYSAVTLSTSFGYNATTNDSQSKKDSRNHSVAITKKASARTKKDHKVTFKVTTVAGSTDQSVRVISNPSQTDTLRIDYFQLARKWKVDLLRYGLRMTYDIVIPNPGSAIVTLVKQVNALDALINTPFTFTLPLSAIYYNSLATDPHNVSNYDQLAAQYDATVTAPPEAQKFVNVHKETAEVNDYDHVHFDSVDFAIDDNYYISEVHMEFNDQIDSGATNDYFTMLGGETLAAGAAKLIGQSGTLSLDFMYQYVYNYAIDITFVCRPKVQVLLDWRLQAWNQIRSAAEDQYDKSIQNYRDQQAKLVQQIADFDALTLRRMEQEEIMKGVLRWLLGPEFYLVPFNIASLFGPDSNDPGVTDVLDPNRLTDVEWLDVMEHGEFIKYIHNAIEWENVLCFTYPYFWDDNSLWDFKKFLYHPDSTHRTFLRSGAARVVLTIRPGFEPSFTSLVETGAFNSLPGQHPYVTIAQEIQDFANTNYPGIPPANPEQDARPLLYLEQRRVWREMQYIIQLLNACKAATGAYPPHDPGQAVPTAALSLYLDGPIVINGTSYAGVNGYNNAANAQQLALDPTTPQDSLLPTYAAVPVQDLIWNNPYSYKSPGDTGDYDLICNGADGQVGGTDKNADISANSEASLISTWYEYTPINAMDIAVTSNAVNTLPPQPDPQIG